MTHKKNFHIDVELSKGYLFAPNITIALHELKMRSLDYLVEKVNDASNESSKFQFILTIKDLE